MELDEKHAISYLLKGNLLLSLNKSDQAITCFKKAYNLKKDLLAFTGFFFKKNFL